MDLTTSKWITDLQIQHLIDCSFLLHEEVLTLLLLNLIMQCMFLIHLLQDPCLSLSFKLCSIAFHLNKVDSVNQGYVVIVKFFLRKPNIDGREEFKYTTYFSCQVGQ